MQYVQYMCKHAWQYHIIWQNINQLNFNINVFVHTNKVTQVIPCKESEVKNYFPKQIWPFRDKKQLLCDWRFKPAKNTHLQENISWSFNKNLEEMFFVTGYNKWVIKEMNIVTNHWSILVKINICYGLILNNFNLTLYIWSSSFSQPIWYIKS